MRTRNFHSLTPELILLTFKIILKMHFSRIPTLFILRNTVENYTRHPLTRLFGSTNAFDHTLLFEKPSGLDRKAYLVFLNSFLILPSPFPCMTLMSDTRVTTLPFCVLQVYYNLIGWGLNNCSQVFTPLLPLRLFIVEH